jgi:hypothetical protein
MSDDSFAREVDEAVRRDQLKALWDKYGLFVVVAAVLIVVGVAGVRGWQYWQSQQAASAGARFVGALQLEDEGKSGDARAAFEALAADGPRGYRILARFQLAAAEAKAGDRAKAVADYDALANDGEAGSILQGYATIRAATLRADEADLAEMTQRVGALAAGDGPWRHSARELLGLAAFKAGNLADAERYFSQALSDPAVPQSLRQRAEMMLALIVKADANTGQ